MTRTMRIRVRVGDTREWVSVLSGSAPGTYLIIPGTGEEFEIEDSGEPLEEQVSRALSNRDASAAE